MVPLHIEHSNGTFITNINKAFNSILTTVSVDLFNKVSTTKDIHQTKLNDKLNVLNCVIKYWIIIKIINQ